MTTTAGTEPERKTYTCGTLTYTKMGLLALFGILLWGDFCFTLFQAVVPSVLPLKLKALNTPNWVMAMITMTVPSFLNMVLCPIISFKSDRHRGRWGRRIPFIASTLPFLCAALVLLAFSDDIAGLLHRNVAPLQQFTPAALTIGVVGVFSVMFTFFDMFVASVFWYLFNDVVPPQFLGRFMGAFRVVGTLAGMLYNWFVYGYANTHMREIFLGSSLLYFVGFGLLCLLLREGKYPPVEEYLAEGEKKGRLHDVKQFLRESFSHKFYWLVFGQTAVGCLGGVIGGFHVFFSLQMGLSLAQIGKLAAITSGAGLVAMYFSSIFVDRWHPVRIGTYITVFGTFLGLGNLVWVFITLPGNYYFWLSLGGSLIATFQAAVSGACGLTRDMRLFPQSRFGQFCSAQAMLRSCLTMIGGVLSGAFLDFVKYLCSGSDQAYRFLFVWGSAFGIATLIITIFLYRMWHRLGGDKSYAAPAPWSQAGTEPMPCVPFRGALSKWLNLALWIFTAVCFMPVVSIPGMMWWMYRNNAMETFFWHAVVLLPLAVAAFLYWLYVRRGVLADMARVRRGESPVNGIPHHGVLVVVSSKALAATGLCVVQTVVSVNLGMQLASTLFTGAFIFFGVVYSSSVWIIARMERGISVTLDSPL